jgi:hypothetical protein
MNNKIEPTYVTFEQAKWLKEKGFNESTLTYWSKRDGLIENEITLRNHNGRGEWGTSRPEQHVVVEWLRINHGIWVYLEIEDDMSTFTWNCVYKMKNGICKDYDEKFYKSPKEAYSAAFDYIRENNLI